MMTKFRWDGTRVLLVVTGVLVILGGCKKDEETGADAPMLTPEQGCKRLAEQRVSCFPRAAEQGVDGLVKECLKTSDEPDFADRIACGDKPCDALRPCLQIVEKTHRDELRTARIAKRVVELQKNIGDEQWKDAGETCRIFAADTDEHPSLGKLCDQVAVGLTKVLYTELVEMRNTLELKDEYGRCMDLKGSAKQVSDDEAKKAETICEELKVAGRVKKAYEAVETAIKEGRANVPYDCEFAIKDLSALDTDWAATTLTAVKKRCNEDLPAKLMKDSVAELVKMRDTGETKDGFRRCFDLKRLTKNLGEAEQKTAEVLCTEVRVAGDANRALSEAKAAVAKQSDRVPFGCSSGLDKLEKVDTDWARATAKKVAQECYVTVGQYVLAARVPKMRSSCELNVRKVYKGVKTYNLKDPAIDAHIAAAAKLCENK